MVPNVTSAPAATSDALQSQAMDTPTGGHDAPGWDRASDALERWPIAQAIYRVIVRTPLEWSTRIGLHGSWGTGKTTVLNYLQQIAEKNGEIVVRFSAWSAGGEGGVIVQFYDALNSELDKRQIEIPPALKAKSAARWALRNTKPATGIAESAVDITGLGKLLEALTSQAESWLGIDKKDIQKLRAALGNKRVVVFVDDLDRADPKIIPKTLLAMRELLDWQGFAFVLAFDKEMIASALGDYSKAFGESANRFLEKIIDVPFELLPPSPTAKMRLARDAIKACCDFIPLRDVDAIARWFPGNPRQAKLIARTFGTLREVVTRHGPGELNMDAMLLQILLRLAAPKFSDGVERELLGRGANAGESDVDISESVGYLLEGCDLSPSPTDTQTKSWLKDLASALVLARRYDDARKIEYEMGLFLRWPWWTRMEFEKMFDQWIEKSTDAQREVVIKEALAAATGLTDVEEIDRIEMDDEQPNIPERPEVRLDPDLLEAARELFSHGLRRYASWFDSALRAATVKTQRSPAAQAEASLDLLEYLWKTSRILPVIRARTCLDVEHELLNIVDRHTDVSDIGLQQALSRERSLFAEVVRGWSRRPNDLLDSLMDVDNRPHRAFEFFNDQVAAALTRTVSSWVMRRSGMGARSSSPAARWLLTSSDSPLYSSEATIRELANAFLDVPRDSGSDRTISDRMRNAVKYLASLVDAIDPPNDVAAWKPSVIPIIQGAWQAATRQEPREAFVAELRSIRTRLLKLNVPTDALHEPDWLRAPLPSSIADVGQHS